MNPHISPSSPNVAPGRLINEAGFFEQSDSEFTLDTAPRWSLRPSSLISKASRPARSPLPPCAMGDQRRWVVRGAGLADSLPAAPCHGIPLARPLSLGIECAHLRIFKGNQS